MKSHHNCKVNLPNKNRLIPAIVIGLCPHGLHIVRTLSRCGIKVIAVESNLLQPTAATKYAEKIYCPDVNSDALIHTMFAIYEQYRVKMPVFLTNDKMLKTMIRNWENIYDKFLFPFENSLIKPLTDKYLLHQIAENHGFKLPYSATIRTYDDFEKIKGSLEFPLILKPALPMGSFKTRICQNEEDIKQVLNSTEKEDLILQGWIPGDEKSIFFCGYYFSKTGECLCSFSGRKLLCYPSVASVTASAEPHEYPELVRKGLAFFKKLRFTGLCSIEYKGSDESDAYFIEVTVGRTDWWLMCATINGINFPLAAYDDLTCFPGKISKQQNNKYIWHLNDQAFPVLIDKLKKGEWNIKEVISYFLKKKRYGVFYINDMFPFILSSFRFGVLVIKKILKRDSL